VRETSIQALARLPLRATAPGEATLRPRIRPAWLRPAGRSFAAARQGTVSTANRQIVRGPGGIKRGDDRPAIEAAYGLQEGREFGWRSTVGHVAEAIDGTKALRSRRPS